MKIITNYKTTTFDVEIPVRILQKKGEYTLVYEVSLPEVKPATRAIIMGIKEDLMHEVKLSEEEIIDERAIKMVQTKIKEKAVKIMRKNFPKESKEKLNNLLCVILSETIGLGPVEYLLNDPELEEVVVHGQKAPAWVYHRTHGWLKTNIFLTEKQVYDYSTIIGRKVGRSISRLDPLLDARLLNGDRINAVLYPISYFGNTITIRKFRKKPWTIVDLIKNDTLTVEEAALLWLATQYEISYLIAGGTASGKTTLLNTLMAFIPPNHRVISIEDTKELQLPSFLYWTSLVVREPNLEGKGGISMQELLINSLRMRPDRIIVGEVRRKFEAETLFEAIHTGHSVYATVHAETGEQTVQRLTHDPMNIPEGMISAIPLIVVMFRDRRKGIRRLSELSEVISTEIMGKARIVINKVREWDSSSNEHFSSNPSKTLTQKIKVYTGMSEEDVTKDLNDKKKVLKWMIENELSGLENVGRIISAYFLDSRTLLEMIRKNCSKAEVLKHYG